MCWVLEVQISYYYLGFMSLDLPLHVSYLYTMLLTNISCFASFLDWCRVSFRAQNCLKNWAWTMSWYCWMVCYILSSTESNLVVLLMAVKWTSWVAIYNLCCFAHSYIIYNGLKVLINIHKCISYSICWWLICVSLSNSIIFVLPDYYKPTFFGLHYYSYN